MNQEIRCSLEQNEPCNSPLLRLAEVQDRFAREAQLGECEFKGFRIPYYIWGQGPPLLFIHGLADDARSFIMPISLLSEHFRCIAYDLRAGGNNGISLGGSKHHDLVGDVFALLDHLHIHQAYLFGSSFGSTICLVAMQQAPKRFPRAVIQGGFAHRPLAPAEVLLSSFARYWSGSMKHLPFRQPLFRRSHYHAFAHREPAVWDYLVERSGNAPMSVVARRALLLHALDIRPILPEIHQPILLVCGDRDPLVDRSCEDVLLQGLPNASRAEIQNCGHYPYLTHPEVLAELILRFLTPLPCSP